MSAGRVVDAALALLDRQIVDRDGMLAGNVDDLELTVPAGGGAPYVTAILAGPGALAGRLGGRLGRWVESVHRRLHHAENAGPARIPFGLVTHIGSHVGLGASREDLDVNLFEQWTRDHIIGKLPGGA